MEEGWKARMEVSLKVKHKHQKWSVHGPEHTIRPKDASVLYECQLMCQSYVVLHSSKSFTKKEE